MKPGCSNGHGPGSTVLKSKMWTCLLCRERIRHVSPEEIGERAYARVVLSEDSHEVSLESHASCAV